MADVTVTPNAADDGGLDLVGNFQALNASDTFKISNSGEMVVYMEETGASTATVTLDTPVTLGGQAVANPTISFTANEQKIVGQFPPSVYGDTLSITCDGTNVQIYAVNLK